MLVDESREAGKHRLIAVALQLHALIKQRRYLKPALQAESDRVCWWMRADRLATQARCCSPSASHPDQTKTTFECLVTGIESGGWECAGR